MASIYGKVDPIEDAPGYRGINYDVVRAADYLEITPAQLEELARLWKWLSLGGVGKVYPLGILVALKAHPDWPSWRDDVRLRWPENQRREVSIQLTTVEEIARIKRISDLEGLVRALEDWVAQGKLRKFGPDTYAVEDVLKLFSCGLIDVR